MTFKLITKARMLEDKANENENVPSFEWHYFQKREQKFDYQSAFITVLCFLTFSFSSKLRTAITVKPFIFCLFPSSVDLQPYSVDRSSLSREITVCHAAGNLFGGMLMQIRHLEKCFVNL